jgi:hypothetical protein
MSGSWKKKPHWMRGRTGRRGRRKNREYTSASLEKLEKLKTHVIRFNVRASKNPDRPEVIGILGKSSVRSKYYIFTPKFTLEGAVIDLRTLKKVSDEESIIWKIENDA